jgi:hypothetical protein
MIVKTPAVKLAVEVREAALAGERIALTGVAGAMPCTVELSCREIFALAGLMLNPVIMAALFRSLFARPRAGNQKSA